MTQHDRRLKLNRHLTSVERPGRYIGGELYAVRPNRDADFRFCLIFPDLYDIGISYLGFQILYHILNRMEGVVCERSYLPWPDMQAMMRRRGVPLYSLESGRELSAFDAVGITLQTELHYPGVVRTLDLAGITRRASDRDDREPLVIGGGPCAFHPEPAAPFFDAFLLGDGEEALQEMVDLMRRRDFQLAPRREKWQRLSGIEGVYVPSLYRQDPDALNRLLADPGTPPRIRARTVTSLKPEYYPNRPIVPFVRGAHDRLTVEIMRGCTRGCRFCQAGMLNRPVRERPVGELAKQVIEGLDVTGWDEVGLLSLSTSDYSGLDALLETLSERLSGRRATLAFPSLRPATFTEALARIDTGGRRSSLTFAVEAGSRRLRDVINKGLDEEVGLAAVERAYRHGWKTVKLYFMVGLPTERMEDIEAGAALIRRIERMMPRGRELHVSVAPFIPKPHSVFEGERFLDADELKRRQRRLFSRISSRRVKTDWCDPERSRIEALLARGDRRLASVVEVVADEGDGFEGWGGMFSAERWHRALAELLPDWQALLRPFGEDEARPWDHLVKGITRRFIREDLAAAYNARRLPDCRTDECYHCGLTGLCDEVKEHARTAETIPTDTGVSVSGGGARLHVPVQPEDGTDREKRCRYRLSFSKLWRARFLGHHDLMRAVVRALHRAGTPLAYSRGYTPRPRVSYSPALPLGYGAVALWIEFETTGELKLDHWLKKMRQAFPPGIRPWEIVPVQPKREDAVAEPDMHRYRLRFDRPLRFIEGGTADNGGSFPGLAGWELDRWGRTLLVELTPVNGRFPSPVEVGSSLTDSDGEAGDRTARLLSVTRIE